MAPALKDSAEDVCNYRLAISELENSELDPAILAQLHAGMNAGKLLTNTRGSARPGIRQRIIFQMHLKGSVYAGKCSYFFIGSAEQGCTTS